MPTEMVAAGGGIFRHALYRQAVRTAIRRKVGFVRSFRVLSEVDDDMIFDAAMQVMPNPEPVGGLIEDVLAWIAEHKEQILAVVKIILTILALFADVPEDAPTMAAFAV
jgi:hypothetical protein